MGLPNFDSPADGVVAMLLMNAVMSVALVRDKIRSVFHLDQDPEPSERRVSITRSLLCTGAECCCCVCLCGFETEEEVSVLLSCNHVFHRGCLDNWLLNHASCPLCRATT